MHVRAALCVLLALPACREPPASRPSPDTRDAQPRDPVSLAGEWRAVLESPGGDLPFGLRIAEGGAPPAIALNGPEMMPFTEVTRSGDAVTLEIGGYDSRIQATLDAAGNTLTGEWTRTALENRTRLPIEITRGYPHRFEPGAPATGSVAGPWKVVFTEEDGATYRARADLEQDGNHVLGTFLTDTGDYRYLEGQLAGNTLSLSCFDGAHAFLFRAELQGNQLRGDFWSRDIYHASWSADRLAPDADDGLADPTEIVRLTNDVGMFQFSFPDAEGNMLSSEDARFAEKVVLVEIFGTWCPNCNDLAPILAGWHRKLGGRGLELVGIAYEFTEDAARNAEMVRRYASRHGVTFPLLLGGISDNARAGSTLPDLSAVKAYPTLVLIGRDGRVRRIYSGFAGPATGETHRTLVRRVEAEIEALLAEPPPT